MGEITKYPFDLNDKPGWLKIRTELADQGRLGGSDIGAAVGDNPYKSPYALWCEKVGLYTPDDASDKEATKQGVMFEGPVAERFEKESGLEVEVVPFIYTNSSAPHLFATPDRLCKDGESGLECKTAKEIVMKKFPRGEFPQQYFDQCCCYLKVTERKRWYIAILIYGVAFNIYLMTTIKEEEERFNFLKSKVDGASILTPAESEEWKSRWSWIQAVYFVDQETLDSVEGAAANFVMRVEEGKRGNMDIWPIDEIDGSKSTANALFNAHPIPMDKSVVTFDSADEFGVTNSGDVYVEAKGAEVCRLVDRRLEYDSLIKQLTSDKKEIDNKLAAMMKDNEKFIVPGCSITYKLSSRETGNVDAIRSYFEAKKMPVPEGMITTSKPTRGIKFYPSKKK